MPGKNRQTPPRHLLVFRTSAMGDVAMLAHAVRALKSAYPALRVTVATQAIFRPFFAGLEVGFLTVAVKGPHHSLYGMWRLAATAKRLGVDAVADVHGTLRSKTFGLAMRLRGVRVADIRKGRDEKREFIRCGGRGAEPVRHTVLRYCDVFRQLGFEFADPGPAAPAVRPNPFGPKQGVWVGFAPFSAQQGKTYPEAPAREVVRLLAGRYDRVFVHGGGGIEAGFAQEMERMYPNVTAVYGKVRLAGEMDLISHLDCVVSMDSLVMHLASLVATPVVSVWGATHPGLGFLGYGCSAEHAVQADMACLFGLRQPSVPVRRFQVYRLGGARTDRGRGRTAARPVKERMPCGSGSKRVGGGVCSRSSTNPISPVWLSSCGRSTARSGSVP